MMIRLLRGIYNWMPVEGYAACGSEEPCGDAGASQYRRLPTFQYWFNPHSDRRAALGSIHSISTFDPQIHFM